VPICKHKYNPLILRHIAGVAKRAAADSAAFAVKKIYFEAFYGLKELAILPFH
jgi:hypothetical protein